MTQEEKDKILSEGLRRLGNYGINPNRSKLAFDPDEEDDGSIGMPNFSKKLLHCLKIHHRSLSPSIKPSRVKIRHRPKSKRQPSSKDYLKKGNDSPNSKRSTSSPNASATARRSMYPKKRSRAWTWSFAE